MAWHFWGFFTIMVVLTLAAAVEWLSGDMSVYGPLFGLGAMALLYWIHDRWDRDG